MHVVAGTAAADIAVADIAAVDIAAVGKLVLRRPVGLC
jgi:hypothetical protein